MTTIYLSMGSVAADDSPRFVINNNGVYYLTKAVWEYDASRQGLTPEQQQGCADIKADFDGVPADPNITVRLWTGATGDDPNQTHSA